MGLVCKTFSINISRMSIDGEKAGETATEAGTDPRTAGAAPQGRRSPEHSQRETEPASSTRTAGMTREELKLQIDSLNFQVEKSLRYHQRRRGFYDGLHRFSMFAIILLGGGAVIDKPQIFGTLASAFAAVNLVWNVSHRARDHEMLFRRFSDLAIEIRTSAHDATEANFADWTERRLAIESDEPPIFYALEADCDNQVRRGWGRDKKLVQIGKWARLTMNWLRHRPADFANVA